MPECPVCGETCVSTHPARPGESVEFPDIYYGASKVCLDGVVLYAHGERL